MQSTRFLAANTLLRQRTANSMVHNRIIPMLRMQPTRSLRLQATPKMRFPVPKEEHSAHTISQRLRTLKNIPVELIPIGVVLAVALLAAAYSMAHKLLADKTLRLGRQGPGRFTGDSEKGH